MTIRKLLLPLVLALVCTAVSAGDSIRFGSRLVKKGDPIGRVIEVAGRPDHVSRIENEFGALVGERWEYYFDGYNARTVYIVIVNGRVYSVEILPH